MSGSVSSAGWGTGYIMKHWVCLYDSFWCWCATTAYTQLSGCSIYWLLLCCRLGGSPDWCDISNGRNVLQWSGGEDLSSDFRGHRTPSLRGIPFTSLWQNESHNWESWELLNALHICCFRELARLRTCSMTGVTSGCGLRNGILWYTCLMLRIYK